VLLLIGYLGVAQVTFQPGYFKDNSGNLVEGYIANEQWGKNPDAFLFKSAVESSEVRYDLADVLVFGIGNSYKYERHTVRMEVSSDLSGDLKFDRSLRYENRDVFLKVVLDGEIRLFAYSSSNNIRFFIQEKSSEEIVPLVFKRYRTQGGNIGYNNQFRQQLEEMFSCDDDNMPRVGRLEYKESDLIRYIMGYAGCSGTTVSALEANTLGNKVIVSARLGLSTGFLVLEQDVLFESPTVNQVRADFGSDLYPRFGLQFEVILPARGNRWSIFVDPSFQKVARQTKFVRKYPTLDVEVQSNAQYVTMELPLGVRRYFYWNPERALFVNLSLSMRFSLDSKIEFTANQALGRPEDIEISATQGYFSAGLGVKLNRRFAVEGRFYGGFDILGDNPQWNAQFGPGGSLILGFSF
jgi:hypothetical protein